MSSRILIIEATTINRIVLKAKLQDTHYQVATCGSHQAAMAMIEQQQPDLILLSFNDGLQSEVDNPFKFCRLLRNNLKTSKIAIVGYGVPEKAGKRFSALKAGADEVIDKVESELLLFAHIRKLLRLKNTNSDIALRQEAREALGLDYEDVHHLLREGELTKVSLLTSNMLDSKILASKLSVSFSRNVTMVSLERTVNYLALDKAPDLFVIDGSAIECPEREIFRLISEIRSQAATHLCGILVVLPPAMSDVAAMALDLGADDVVSGNASAAEIAFRARVIVGRKYEQEHLRDSVRDGLLAAVTDELTELFNRRYAEAHVVQMMQNTREHGDPFGVLVVDIDFFKVINDTYGHAIGDHILKQVAKRLRDSLRGIDVIARVGGEEFMVALPNTTLSHIKEAALRLCEAVRDKPFTLPNGDGTIRVTVSVGAAMVGAGYNGGLNLSEISHEADIALYRAKEDGRNCVHLISAQHLSLAG